MSSPWPAAAARALRHTPRLLRSSSSRGRHTHQARWITTTPSRCSAPAAGPAARAAGSSQAATTSTTTTTTSSSSSSSSSSSPSSVNPDQINHFNTLAATWWDPYGSSRVLHLMNPLRHDFIRDCHASQPDPLPAGAQLRYLDIGCGGGIFAESAARLPSAASVTAVDPSPEVLAVARRHARRDPALAAPRLTYLHASVESLQRQQHERSYDVVSLFEVVEHVTDPAAFLERCGALVRPGGWLVMSTIARTWVSWFTTNFLAEDVLRMVPKGTHDWRQYINDAELRAHFSRPGWNSPRCMGVVYVPGLGWKVVGGSEKVGNYFFAVRKD